MINSTTRDQIDAALVDDNPDNTPAAVFALAVASRAVTSAVTLTTTFTSFAVVEAGKQAAPGRSVKTWVVTSANPRPEHKRMDGETVPTEGRFSNGSEWPGDPALGADGVAGCECTVRVGLSDE
jgi:hypothetical protein